MLDNILAAIAEGVDIMQSDHFSPAPWGWTLMATDADVDVDPEKAHPSAKCPFRWPHANSDLYVLPGRG